MRHIAHGTINPDSTIELTWTRPDGESQGTPQHFANMQTVKEALLKFGVRQYTIGDGRPAESGIQEFEIYDNTASVEAELFEAGTQLEYARRQQQQAMQLVRQLIRKAVDAGISEAQAARLTRIDRMTARRILGKKR